MNRDDIRKLLQDNQTFTIHLADGRKFDVPHRDFIAVGPDAGRTVTVYDVQGTANILNLRLIASLEVKAA